MRIGHFEIFVRNPQESRSFYEKVLGFEVEAVQGDGQLIWLKLGGSEILLRPGKNPSPSPTYKEAPTAIVLYTQNLEATIGCLAKRGLEIKDDDGPGCPTFTDPDGNWFQLVCPT